MKKKVYMRLNPLLSIIALELQPSWRDFLDERGEFTVLLDKALYGTIEAVQILLSKMVSS